MHQRPYKCIRAVLAARMRHVRSKSCLHYILQLDLLTTFFIITGAM